jgi:uncharacterized protein YbaR (Trm112 family)
MYTGNSMIDAIYPVKKEEHEAEQLCKFCGEFYPVSQLIPTMLNHESIEICTSCNNDLHTCAWCGEKIVKGEKYVTGKQGQFFHDDCL